MCCSCNLWKVEEWDSSTVVCCKNKRHTTIKTSFISILSQEISRSGRDKTILVCPLHFSLTHAISLYLSFDITVVAERPSNSLKFFNYMKSEWKFPHISHRCARQLSQPVMQMKLYFSFLTFLCLLSNKNRLKFCFIFICMIAEYFKTKLKLEI